MSKQVSQREVIQRANGVSVASGKRAAHCVLNVQGAPFTIPWDKVDDVCTLLAEAKEKALLETPKSTAEQLYEEYRRLQISSYGTTMAMDPELLVLTWEKLDRNHQRFFEYAAEGLLALGADKAVQFLRNVATAANTVFHK